MYENAFHSRPRPYTRGNKLQRSQVPSLIYGKGWGHPDSGREGERKERVEREMGGKEDSATRVG